MRPAPLTANGAPRTLFQKVWDMHVVTSRDDGEDLLWIDRHFLHEGSHHAFRKLAGRGASVARPDLTFAVADHYAPTRGRERGEMVQRLEANAGSAGIRLFGLDDRSQGIVHVVGPEQWLTFPGLTVVCGDSQTSTHGAFGAVAFRIGATDVAHVLETQCLWQRRPRQMRVQVDGVLSSWVTAKDLALSIIAAIGADGAQGHAVEYAGDAVRALSMEGRLTLCNMSIESGARCGMIAPDPITLAYLRGRGASPLAFELAAEAWLTLSTDPDAVFDGEFHLDASAIGPVASWGINPEEVLPVTGVLPDPGLTPDPGVAARLQAALSYMDLRPGQPMTDIRVDRVFIGSCTNARIEDLRMAASVLRGRRARVPGMVSPGSTPVKRQAEVEGLDQVFIEAGLDWVESGCSMCVGMNGDVLQPGERCASTTNRNFKGRQGAGSRTHLMSPAMVAAAAVAGHIVDVRSLCGGD